MPRQLKILAILLLFLALHLFKPTSAMAGIFTSNEMLEEYCRARQGDQMNLETWYSGKCGGDLRQRIGFADMIKLDIDTKLGLFSPVNNETGEIGQVHPELMFASLGNFLAEVYKARPVSTGKYLEYVAQNMKDKHLVEPAYAQTGFGFRSLGPVLEIWRAFRDLAYLVFVLAFVLYGFMIMFRMKINPQTVANIESTIPKLVATLLLITFSYAIAGFIIDLTYLIQELIVNAVFANIHPSATSTFSIFGFDVFNINWSNNVVTRFFLGLFGSTPDAAMKFIARIFIGQQGGLMAPLLYMLLAMSIGGVIPRIMSVLIPSYGVDWVDSALRAFTNNPLINLIVSLVVIIAVFYTFFKITFALIKAFTITIIQVVFAPLIILGDVLPGNNSFGNWWRTILANMAVFPATIICFLLSFIFLGPLVFDPANQFGSFFGLARFLGLRWTGELSLYELANITSNPLIVPPPLGMNVGLIAGGVRADAMMAFVGLGIFMMTPKLLDMIQEALKVPAFKYGTALGEALAFGWRPVSAPIGFARGVAAEAGAQIKRGIVTTAGEQLGFIQQQRAAAPGPVTPVGAPPAGTAPGAVGAPGGPTTTP